MKIGPAVRKLIAESIVSVEQLEVLLLLRERCEHGCTVNEINDHIRSSLSSVNVRLSDLQARRLIRREGERFRYDPPEDLLNVITELAQAYSESRFSVIDLIFSKPVDRLRVFANAFKVKKGE